MAAVTRLLHLSQLQLIQHIVPTIPNIGKRLTESIPTRSRSNGSNVNFRRVSNISKLQPTFPEHPDEFLFEYSSNEYEYEEGYEHKTLDSSTSSVTQANNLSPSQLSNTSQTNQTYQTQTHPCDSLAAVAQDENLRLGNALLKEYTEANISIIHRPQYERLAILSLQNREIDMFFSWLSLVPAANAPITTTTSKGNDDDAVDVVGRRGRGQLPGGQQTDLYIIEALVNFSSYFNYSQYQGKRSKRQGPLLDHMAKLLLLFVSKGWVHSTVPIELIGFLSQYLKPEKFYPILRQVLSVHAKAAQTARASQPTQNQVPAPAQNEQSDSRKDVNSSGERADVGVASDQSQEYRAVQAAWIARAIHEFSVRNKPEVAYEILLDSSSKTNTTTSASATDLDMDADENEGDTMDLILSQHEQSVIELYQSATRERQRSIAKAVYERLSDNARTFIHQTQDEAEGQGEQGKEVPNKATRIKALTNTIISQHAISLMKASHSSTLARAIYHVGGKPMNNPVPVTSIERDRAKTAQILRLLKRELAPFSRFSASTFPTYPKSSTNSPSPTYITSFNSSTFGASSKVTRSRQKISIDHRPVAFLFYALSLWDQEGVRKGIEGSSDAGSVMPKSNRFFQLFRKRVQRNATKNSSNDEYLQAFWALVEFERLCYLDDSHSAIHYYRRVFLPEGAPTYILKYNRFEYVRAKEERDRKEEVDGLWRADDADYEEYEEDGENWGQRGRVFEKSRDQDSAVVTASSQVDPFWMRWMEKSPLRTPQLPFSLPSSSLFTPKSMKLRPNNMALQAIWKASLTLSLRDPDMPQERQNINLYLKGYDYKILRKLREEQLQAQMQEQIQEQAKLYQPEPYHSTQPEALSPSTNAHFDPDNPINSEHTRHTWPPKLQNITHLSALFDDFLSIYDRLTKNDHFFFSNLFTRESIFELFLKRLVKFASAAPLSSSSTSSSFTSPIPSSSFPSSAFPIPSTLASDLASRLMQEMQSRGINVSHRMWAIFASMKVRSGDPQFMIQALEILEQDMMGPLDFSPRALGDMSKIGFKPARLVQPDRDQRSAQSSLSSALMPNADNDEIQDENGQYSDHLIPQKLFNAYNYAFKQLITREAFPEAVQLHQKILEAGYVEGNSVSFDRLVYELVENMRRAYWKSEDRVGTRLSSSRGFRRKLGVKGES